MKIKTSDLEGQALDYAVAVCEGIAVTKYTESPSLFFGKGFDKWQPSTDWAQGGLIIERERICISYQHPRHISGEIVSSAAYFEPPSGVLSTFRNNGCTPLVAAMRCYVASKLGDVVEIPDELIKENEQ